MIQPILKPGAAEGRVVKTKRQMQAERLRRWNAGDRTCGICNLEVTSFEDYVLDHIEPASCHLKNDADENLQAAHFWCNSKKGSRRKFLILKGLNRP